MSSITSRTVTFYKSFIPYYRTDYSATGNLPSYNVNVDIGTVLLSRTDNITYNTTSKKIIIDNSGKYEVSILMRTFVQVTGSSFAPSGNMNIDFYVGTTVAGQIRFTNALSSVTGFSTYPYYADLTSNAAETPPNQLTIVNGGSTPSLTINSNYYYRGIFTLQSGAEIYLNHVYNGNYYSGFNRTYPQGPMKLSNIFVEVKRVD